MLLTRQPPCHQPDRPPDSGVAASISFEGFQDICSTSPMGLSDTCPLLPLLSVVRSCSHEWSETELGWNAHFGTNMAAVLALSLALPQSPLWWWCLRGRVKSTSKEITLWKFSGYILKSSRGDTTERCVVLSSQHKIPNSKFNCLLLRGKATVVDTSLRIQRLAGVVLINKTQEQPLNVFGS